MHLGRPACYAASSARVARVLSRAPSACAGKGGCEGKYALKLPECPASLVDGAAHPLARAQRERDTDTDTDTETSNCPRLHYRLLTLWARAGPGAQGQ